MDERPSTRSWPIWQSPALSPATTVPRRSPRPAPTSMPICLLWSHPGRGMFAGGGATPAIVSPAPTSSATLGCLSTSSLISLGLRLQVSGHKLQVSGLRAQASGLRSQGTSFRSQVSGHKLQVSGFILSDHSHTAPVGGCWFSSWVRPGAGKMFKALDRPARR